MIETKSEENEELGFFFNITENKDSQLLCQ